VLAPTTLARRLTRHELKPATRVLEVRDKYLGCFEVTRTVDNKSLENFYFLLREGKFDLDSLVRISLRLEKFFPRLEVNRLRAFVDEFADLPFALRRYYRQHKEEFDNALSRIIQTKTHSAE
jgi:hypothetical protein